ISIQSLLAAPFRRDTLTTSRKSNAGDPPRLTALIGSDLETTFGFLRYTQSKYTGELRVERDASLSRDGNHNADQLHGRHWLAPRIPRHARCPFNHILTFHHLP